MYRDSIELQKHDLYFGRTRKAVHSFFKFSQTFTSVYL